MSRECSSPQNKRHLLQCGSFRSDLLSMVKSEAASDKLPLQRKKRSVTNINPVILCDLFGMVK